MRMKSLVTLIVLSPLTLCAAGKITPLDVKLGLWEVSSTGSSSGTPPIPADMLANLTPEQRAKVDAMIKARQNQSPKTRVRKSCLTKEKLDKDMAFDERDQACTRTVVNSTSSKLEVKMVCSDADTKMKSEGTFDIEAANSENVKGTIHMVASGSEHAMNFDNTFTAKYLGPVCGDVK